MATRNQSSAIDRVLLQKRDILSQIDYEQSSFFRAIA